MFLTGTSVLINLLPIRALHPISFFYSCKQNISPVFSYKLLVFTLIFLRLYNRGHRLKMQQHPTTHCACDISTPYPPASASITLPSPCEPHHWRSKGAVNSGLLITCFTSHYGLTKHLKGSGQMSRKQLQMLLPVARRNKRLLKEPAFFVTYVRWRKTLKKFIIFSYNLCF
jgi:hypothetical protein